MTGWRPSSTGRNISARSTMPSSIAIGGCHVICMPSRTSVRALTSALAAIAAPPPIIGCACHNTALATTVVRHLLTTPLLRRFDRSQIPRAAAIVRVSAEHNENASRLHVHGRLRSRRAAFEGNVNKTTAISPEIIGQAIDMVGPNKRLMFIISVAAAGYFFDSFDISIISYVLPSVAKEFQLAPQKLGLVGSAGLG